MRFLRNENSFLKGQDLLREIESLPVLPVHEPRLPTPELVASGSDSEDSDSDGPGKPVSLLTLTAQSKLLYREVIKFSSSPKVVDLTAGRPKDGNARGWVSKKKTPAYQVWERRMEGEKLTRKLGSLQERTSSIQSILSRR